jgi:DNA primase
MRFDKAKRTRIERAVRMADVKKILNHLKISYTEQKRGDLWFKCTSLSHKDKDASTHVCSDTTSHNHGIWHCFGCDDSGNIIILVRDWLNISFWEAVLIVESMVHDGVVSPVRQITPSALPTIPHQYEFYDDQSKWNPPYLEYLFDRNILWSQIIKHQIGYCDSGRYSRRIIVPVYLNGILQTWVGRSIVGGKRITSCKNGNPGLFGSRHALPRLGPLIVSEGWTDALAIERLGYNNSTALQTNMIHEVQFEFMKRFEYVILIPDGDPGGDRLIDSVAIYINEQEFHIAELPRGLDPAHNNMDPDVLEVAIEESKPWEPVRDPVRIMFEF